MDKYLLTPEELERIEKLADNQQGLAAIIQSQTYTAAYLAAQAQHLKSVKAVLEAIEEELQETDDGWFIEFKDYEALKKELLENFDKLEGK